MSVEIFFIRTEFERKPRAARYDKCQHFGKETKKALLSKASKQVLMIVFSSHDNPMIVLIQEKSPWSESPRAFRNLMDVIEYVILQKNLQNIKFIIGLLQKF